MKCEPPWAGATPTLDDEAKPANDSTTTMHGRRIGGRTKLHDVVQRTSKHPRSPFFFPFLFSPSVRSCSIAPWPSRLASILPAVPQLRMTPARVCCDGLILLLQQKEEAAVVVVQFTSINGRSRRLITRILSVVACVRRAAVAMAATATNAFHSCSRPLLPLSSSVFCSEVSI